MEMALDKVAFLPFAYIVDLVSETLSALMDFRYTRTDIINR